MINAQDIAKLRNETGAGVMDAKRALEEANGDYQKAKQVLSDNAQVIAKKKSERATNHGLVEAYVHGGRIGVLVEINCESDFVAKNVKFKELAHSIAMQIASMNPQDIEELLGQEFILDSKMTVQDLVHANISQFGENMQIKRFVRFELGEEINS